MQKQILTPESYVMQFGKYRNMRAIDVANIYEVDKNGEDKPKGLLYLQWIAQQEWFKPTNIIEQIIKNAIDCVSADDEKEQVNSLGVCITNPQGINNCGESTLSTVVNPVEETIPIVKQKKEKKEKKEKKPKDMGETVLNFD